MPNLREQVLAKLGKNKDLLSPMFKHIMENVPNGEKLTMDNID